MIRQLQIGNTKTIWNYYKQKSLDSFIILLSSARKQAYRLTVKINHAKITMELEVSNIQLTARVRYLK